MVSVHDHKTLPGEKMQVHMDKVNHTTYLCLFFMCRFAFQKAACAGFHCGQNLEHVAVVLNQVSLLDVSDVFSVCWFKASA